MTNHVPQWLQPASGDADITYSGFELRNLFESVHRKANGFISERGVLASGSGFGFKVTQRGAGANFSVDVASGRAVITDGDVTNGGPAYVWSDATFNLVTPSPPATGTNLHRVVLQLRNKLENGTWTTYDFIPVLVADTSSGGSGTFPAEPTSAITLAQVSIAAGQANVSNANITDYREGAGPNSGYKAADTTRTTSTMAADPDLQFNNLAANAIYAFTGVLFYMVGSGTDMKIDWNVTGASLDYWRAGINASANLTSEFGWTPGTVPTIGGLGATTLAAHKLEGTIDTANAPCSAVLKWAANTNTGFNCVLKAGSYIRAARLS